ncbi:MAG: undecaprenyl-diphosphate phosphatase [Christensenellales bacterium]
MTIWEAILLGIIQGLTEFLPVSSSGHLAIVQDILGVEEPLFFDTLLHLGTLIAVCTVFYRKIIDIFKNFFSKTVLLFVIATIPAAIAGVFLESKVESMFAENIAVVSVCFLLTAILLLVTEYLGKRFTEKKEISYTAATVMGLAQAVAIFPGISRSGSTICAGVLCKGDREKVADFSFIMSIPIILGATLYQTYKLVTAEAGTLVIEILPTLAGVIAAAISGYLAIKFMLRLIAKCNFKWFSLYLTILAVVTLLNNTGVIAIW